MHPPCLPPQQGMIDPDVALLMTDLFDIMEARVDVEGAGEDDNWLCSDMKVSDLTCLGVAVGNLSIDKTKEGQEVRTSEACKNPRSE